ncbi:MAG: prolyl oligopeptidase family serine peptidase, partial [Verrucomicrobia bacterium]|nr:prolyl oligopeptidase family serine peptidase [Verrucomicrobiota bacterium]
MKKLTVSVAVYFGVCWVSALALEPIPVIERRIPPKGVELPAELRANLESELKVLQARVKKLKAKEVDTLDAEVFVKALRFSLVNGEYFSDKDFQLGDKMVALAKERLAGLESGDTPWTDQRGLLVRGYRSAVDGSVQPYGLHVPEDINLKKPAPLLIWLHGRGDKVTDMHFINRSLAKNAALGGYFDSSNVITLAPFGRQCIGWKHSGEIDIFEAIEQVKKQYQIDEDRIVLAGFSMGGAGAWHVGAHYTEKFCAVQPGAGFAETAKYNKLKLEDYPVWYEQKLWGIYDTPDYIRNLLNTSVVLYSGENDKQRAAGELMAKALRAEGLDAPHLIGPGMGHKFHPDTAAEVQKLLEKAIKDGRNSLAKKVSVQTKTLRYPRVHWVEITGLTEHWKDSRVDAEMKFDNLVHVTTKNVTSLQLTRKMNAGTKITIDEQDITLKKGGGKVDLVKVE